MQRQQQIKTSDSLSSLHGPAIGLLAALLHVGCASSPKGDFVPGPGGVPTDNRLVKFLHPDIGSFLNTGTWRRVWIVTGGQTGVDRAALDFAMEHHLPTRGWSPLGRKAEDGAIEQLYPVQETSSVDPAMRTELNALDSDGTLVLSAWQPKDGTPLTITAARLHDKPVFEVDLSQPNVPSSVVVQFRQWVSDHNIHVLNIGGPRESLRPGEVYRNARQILAVLFLSSFESDTNKLPKR